MTLTPRPILDVAARLGLDAADVLPYGHDKAKIHLRALEARRHQPDGQLVLVSAITPTPPGDGKTTITIGLGQGLSRLGRRPMVALREPSLGPCFGVKGGGTGGGRAQVVPADDINLHFTGDLHAVESAHNLLAACLDNHLFHGNARGIDHRQVLFPRAMDMNDRALREIVIGLGGRSGGYPREGGFVITAASEVMAALCLAGSLSDLKTRLGRILLGFAFDGTPVVAEDLKVTGAMTALLRDALHPNLVQTFEGTPALVHGGPFANIAHGCNSVVATRLALKLGDIVVTEAGFGADLGAEKFFDIKCVAAGLVPAAVVLVATARALKYHGGVPMAQVDQEDLPAIKRGMANLEHHVEVIRRFGVPPLVAVNRFPSDTDAELAAIVEQCAALEVPAVVADVFARGGAGGEALAGALTDLLARATARFRPLYDWAAPVRTKIETIATLIYGADRVVYTRRAEGQVAQAEALGLGGLPICMAKTQRSLADDPSLLGRPRDFAITVSAVQISAGAGFLVPITGDVLTMPGLPRVPTAERVDVDAGGRITGL
ncbi:MAG TPA: formate--tetrahydrofolate ligase [Methylomirabilota bacterium]|nr:formate--tetrahydrofolate ligase [Methylomirabilota bacterium]